MARSPVAGVSSTGAPGIPPGTEESFVEIDGARMRYLRAGSGPALVLVHGLMGYAFSWRFVLPELSRVATVYAVDLLGAGYSDRPQNLDCRLRPSSERLLQFLDKVGIQSLDLLGTSHGGAVSIMAAALAKDRKAPRIRKLILVAPVNPWSAHGRWLAPALGSSIGSRLFILGARRYPATYPFALRRLYGDPKRIPPGTLEGYMAPSSEPGYLEYGLKVASHWNASLQELEAALPKAADYPTLLMWGRDDRAVYASSAQALSRHFRKPQVVIFPGIGHLPYEEAPEDFNRTLMEFLAQSVPSR